MEIDWEDVDKFWKPWIEVVEEDLTGGGDASDRPAAKLIKRFNETCPKSATLAATAALSAAKWHPAVHLSLFEREHLCGHCYSRLILYNFDRDDIVGAACVRCPAAVPVARRRSWDDAPCQVEQPQQKVYERLRKVYLNLYKRVPKGWR